MNIAKKVWFIIPAAGVGRRFSGPMPKQFMPYQNRFIFTYGLETILASSHVAGVILATEIPDTQDEPYQHWIEFQKEYAQRLSITQGAEERITSVEAGLNALLHHPEWQVAQDDYVLVHDGARPCLSPVDLNHVIEQIDFAQKDALQGVMLGKPVSDTLKKVNKFYQIEGTQERQGLWQASTPQGAAVRQLHKAYEVWHENFSHLMPTDECQLLALAGIDSKAVQSSQPNPKLTFPDDLPLIFHLLAHR